MSKKLALLALLPMVSFVLIPVATANSGLPIYLNVSCENTGGPTAGVSLTYHGTTLAIVCPHGTEKELDTYVWAGRMFTFTATIFVGGSHQTIKGSFGVSDYCTLTGTSLYSQNEESNAGFYLEGVCE